MAYLTIPGAGRATQKPPLAQGRVGGSYVCGQAAAGTAPAGARVGALTLGVSRGLTHEEVACALRVPLGTTKTRIRSGLLKLRVELTSLGVAA